MEHLAVTHYVIKTSFLQQGSVSAMAMALPLDTARVRLVLDDARESKSTWETILDLIEEEGV